MSDGFKPLNTNHSRHFPLLISRTSTSLLVPVLPLIVVAVSSHITTCTRKVATSDCHGSAQLLLIYSTTTTNLMLAVIYSQFVLVEF